jgi:hypothetical protein
VTTTLPKGTDAPAGAQEPTENGEAVIRRGRKRLWEE